MFKPLPIEGLPNHEINEFGIIRNLKTGKTLVERVNTTGYVQYSLQENKVKYNLLAHRLVAMLWIPNPDNKPEVNHIDKDRKNNHYSNLEWVTSKENTCHSRGIVAKEYICPTCGKELPSRQSKFCSKECKPMKEELNILFSRPDIQYLLNNYSFVSLAKAYNVSDNGIKKLATKLGYDLSIRGRKTFLIE